MKYSRMQRAQSHNKGQNRAHVCTCGITEHHVEKSSMRQLQIIMKHFQQLHTRAQ